MPPEPTNSRISYGPSRSFGERSICVRILHYSVTFQTAKVCISLRNRKANSSVFSFFANFRESCPRMRKFLIIQPQRAIMRHFRGTVVNPRLVAVAGPLNGTAAQITGTETLIGRDPSNRICVDSRSVSRRHCVIQQDGNQFLLRDLESLNGTFVNDVPIKERVLKAGDQITLGDSVFVFVLDQDETADPLEGVGIDETTMVNLEMIRLPLEESIYLQKAVEPVKFSRPARVVGNLNALLRFSTAISSVQTIDELNSQLLTSIADIVPAEYAAFLHLEPDETQIDVVCGWDRKKGLGANVQPSTTIVKQVIDSRTAVLAKGIAPGGLYSGAESIASSRVRSVLCVPVQAVRKLLGVIYLATADPAAQFDEDHLQLMTAVSSVAAVAVQNARQVEFLRGENQRLQEEINLNHSMVGESSAMRQVYQLISKVAQADSTVLINGESGTGKELVARAIHQNSPRRDKPFVAINCAAIPETLLESELFGTEKGAYTGASQRKGKLETAEGGTVLLDEIGELPLPVQAKLLRVLQERRFERLGGTRSIPVNIRWLAATNRDLKQAVQSRTFREDLYFRLQVITIRMPALRERREDIPLLAGYFALRFSKTCGRPVKGISPAARARLTHYDWPGNVRELENTIERAIVFGSGDYVLPEDLNEDLFEKELPAEVDAHG